MVKDPILNYIYSNLSIRDLNGAIKCMENYLALHPHQINSDILYAIKADYQVMIDYWRNGYKDPQLPQLYEKLLYRMYTLYGNVETNSRVLRSPLLSSLFMKAHLSPRDLTVQVVREQLESFVSNIALLELDPPHTVAERRKALYQQHTQLMSELFAHILTSNLWTEGQGEATEQLLLAPTVDSADQQLIISAITLAAMNCFDMVKFRALINVYLQSNDEHVRQRALVGWVFSVDNDLEQDLFPEMTTLVEKALKDPSRLKEVVELQKQIYYCVSAEEDRETIQKEIMPDLIKNQNNITSDGILDQDEESILNDILHPDEEERNLEKVESSLHRMMDMQKQGSDIYFGGFSQMKRFAFFNEISNWFTPFYINHPAIAKAKEKFANVKFLQGILEYGPFCNSDKYSFVLAFESVLNQIPEHVREMLDRGEAQMVQKIANGEMNTPAYIRRIYLQDMYRFFRLHPLRSEFKNVFEDEYSACLFIRDDIYMNTDAQAYYKELASFLIKRNRKKDALALLLNLVDEQYHDYDYYMLMAYLEDNPQSNYERALELNSKSERALLGLARIWFKDDKYEQALDAYNQLLEMNPDKKSYQLNKSVCLTNLHRYEEAEQILFRLNYEDAENLNVARVLAWTLTCDGKYEQAGRLYDQLLSEEKTAGSDFINYGFYLWFLGRIDDAASCFRNYEIQSKPVADRRGDIYSIIHNERPLLLKKGITLHEITMMIDWIDV